MRVYREITLNTQNHTERNLENDMETGTMYRSRGISGCPKTRGPFLRGPITRIIR